MAIKRSGYRIFALCLFIFALIFSGIRAITPWVSHYCFNQKAFQQKIEQNFSVSIGNCSLQWYWFQPVLALEKVAYQHEQQRFKAQKIYIGINILQSLWNRRFEPGLLYVKDAVITMQQEPSASEPIQERILSVMNRLVLDNVTFHFLTLEGRKITIKNIQFRAKQLLGRVYFTGKGLLGLMPVELLADIYDGQGHAYLRLNNIHYNYQDLPMAVMNELSPEFKYVQQLEGKGEFWIDIEQKQWVAVQAKLNLNNIIIDNTPLHAIQTTVAFKKIPTGWQLTADKIKFCPQQQCWPENVIHVNYFSASKTYKAYIKTLVFNPSLNAKVSALKLWQPKGVLQNTQLIYNDQDGLKFLLTKFHKLSWMAHDTIPGIQDLSGVVYWQPKEGHLEIDSNQTKMISPMHDKKQTPYVLTTVNAGVEWKLLSDGYRINLDHFVTTSPDLIISAQGVLDQAESQNPHLRLKAEFSAQNAENLLIYIPSQWVKPKLDAWLKHDVKRIKKATGQIHIDGVLSDIKITSYLKGVDLSFHPDWPVTKNIEAYLNIEKGNLQATVVHAELGSAPVQVKQVDLRVDHLGQGHETLLVHGKIDESWKKLLKYVQQSPLKSRLEKLQEITIQNTLPLDLHLEIPLYPENNDVYLQGSVLLDDEKLTIQDGVKPLLLTHVTGELRFDVKGLNKSSLKATIFDQTLDLTVSTAGSNIVLFSTLEGLKIDLPAPLGKTAAAVKPTHLVFDFDSAVNMSIQGDYGRQLFIKMKRLNQDEWDVVLRLRELNADLKYHPLTHTLSGHVPNVWIDSNWFASQSSKKYDFSPQDIPNLNISIDNLYWNRRALGVAALKSRSDKDHWQLDEFSLRTDAYSFALKGHWQRTLTNKGIDNLSRIDAQINLRNLEKTLKYWKMPAVVDAKRGSITLTGEWKKPFFDFSWAAFIGEGSMSLRNGSITHFDKATEEKIGLGKLLSILSLQTIPRRLTLDFSDLSQSGYSFDVFDGHFKFKQGVMSTQDTYVDGPVAYASMKGDLDLDKRLYDLKLQVSPHIAASLPIVATIAGGPVAGPVAGIATWMAIKLINQGMEKISSYSYRVSGPWLDPIVQQTDIKKKKSEPPGTS